MIARIFRRTWRIIVTVIIVYILFLILRNRQQITDTIFRNIRHFIRGIINSIRNLIPHKIKDTLPINVLSVIIQNLTQSIL